MAEIVINPDIAKLDKDPSLAARKTIFDTLLDGMKKANEGTPPDYSQGVYVTPSVDKDGNQIYWTDPDGNQIALSTPNQPVIEKKMAEISDIQMQNAAYLFASVIATAANSAAAGVDLTGYLEKAGGSMTGLLGALHGFEAGADGQMIFNVIKNAANELVAHVYGSLIVDDDLDVAGQINLGDDGIWFSKHKTIFYDNNILKIENQNIAFKGDIAVDGSFKLGDVLINSNGIFWDTKEFYHSGNCNLPTVDWEMKDAHVAGNLTVDGSATYNGHLTALNGFDLGEGGNKLFYSVLNSADNSTKIMMLTDLDIAKGRGIMFDDKYIIQIRDGANNIISFSAPGRILNLGDSSGIAPNKIATQFISLQADLYDSSHTRKLISYDGAGNFPNGFSAGVANAGDWAMRTFTHSAQDYGVVFHRMIALGDEYGPKFSTESSDATGTNNHEVLKAEIPYKHVVGGSDVTERFGVTFTFGHSGSIWHYPASDTEHDVSLHINTDGEFIIFDKPVEAKTFSINSLNYKTQLKENALFLREGIFIEGVTDGMAFTGNAYFNNNVQTPKFASGFAGYGWGIIKSEFAGGYHATFDELTVRKKMRVYELEVQKNSVTNGSLWVTDSCSGDIVEEIIDTI